MITLQPSSATWSSASKSTWSFITVVNSLVPSAVRNSTERFCVAKLTGKISRLPPKEVTNRPRLMPDSSRHASSSPRTETGPSVTLMGGILSPHHLPPQGPNGPADP